MFTVDDDGVMRDLGSRVVFLRTPYNYNMDVASNEDALHCKDESLAVQSGAEEADINTIVRRFGLTGQLPTDLVTPMQGDFTHVVDYQSALNAVIAADEAFMQMPAEVRTRFQNDAQQFLEFVSDDKNRDEARKLGLLMPEAPKRSPVEVRVIPDPPVSGG